VAVKASSRQRPPEVEVEAQDLLASGRRAKPVKIFAFLGVIWLALIVYSWTQALMQGHLHAAPTGPSPLPTWMRVSLTTWQLLFPVIFVVTGWHFLVKPWRRERRLTSDGVMFLSFPSLWFLMDPQQNYLRTTVNFNSHVVNIGCPQCHVPGWINPHADRFPEPLVGMLIYGGPIFLGAVVCCAIMRRAKRRWPHLGPLGLVGVAVGCMASADLIMELGWVLTGFYTYGGVIKQFTVFHGHFWQWPLYEPLMWGPTWAGFACIRYFKDDKGRSLAERGVDQIRTTPSKQAGLRLLAMVGALNTTMFILFALPNQWVAVLVNSYPSDVQSRSYFTNMMCGPGTDTACPGENVPIPMGNNSIRLGPDHEIVRPAGVR
jgi:hypothetical protein